MQGYAPPGEKILPAPVIVVDTNYKIAEWTPQAIRIAKYPRSHDKPSEQVVVGEKFEKVVQKGQHGWERIETYLSDALLGETTYDVEVHCINAMYYSLPCY